MGGGRGDWVSGWGSTGFPGVSEDGVRGGSAMRQRPGRRTGPRRRGKPESCPGFPGGTSEPFIKLKRGRGGFGGWGGRRTACDSRILWAAANDTLAHSPHPTTCARIHDPDHYTVRASPRRRTLPDAKQNVPCEVSISALRRMKVGHTCRAYRPICGSSHLLCQIHPTRCNARASAPPAPREDAAPCREVFPAGSAPASADLLERVGR